jgi:hypothetical protein
MYPKWKFLTYHARYFYILLLESMSGMQRRPILRLDPLAIKTAFGDPPTVIRNGKCATIIDDRVIPKLKATLCDNGEELILSGQFLNSSADKLKNSLVRNMRNEYSKNDPLLFKNLTVIHEPVSGGRRSRKNRKTSRKNRKSRKASRKNRKTTRRH